MRGAEKVPVEKMYLSLFLAVEQRKESDCCNFHGPALCSALLLRGIAGDLRWLLEGGKGCAAGSGGVGGVEGGQPGLYVSTGLQHHVTVADKHWCPLAWQQGQCSCSKGLGLQLSKWPCSWCWAVVVFKNFLIFLLSQQLHQNTPSSESNWAQKTPISNKKKEIYFPSSFIAQASTLALGQVQTNTMSFGQLSGFQVYPPLHPSHFSQLSCAREQGLWRTGRGASPDPRAAGGRFTTRVLSHSRGAWATKVSGASMGTSPTAQGCASGLAALSPCPTSVSGSAFACLVALSVILAAISVGPRSSWPSAAGQGCGAKAPPLRCGTAAAVWACRARAAGTILNGCLQMKADKCQKYQSKEHRGLQQSGLCFSGRFSFWTAAAECFVLLV